MCRLLCYVQRRSLPRTDRRAASRGGCRASPEASGGAASCENVRHFPPDAAIRAAPPHADIQAAPDADGCRAAHLGGGRAAGVSLAPLDAERIRAPRGGGDNRGTHVPNRARVTTLAPRALVHPRLRGSPRDDAKWRGAVPGRCVDDGASLEEEPLDRHLFARFWFKWAFFFVWVRSRANFWTTLFRHVQRLQY